MILIFGTLVSNDNISWCFFFIFSKFWFFGFSRGKLDKKWSKMTKFFVGLTRYLRKHTSFDCHIWFFNIFIFRVVREVKWQKTVQNNKKFCSSHFISQGPNIISLSFMVHMCKMIIFPGLFSSFSKFWYFRLLGGKRAKNGPKWQEILSAVFHISGVIHQSFVKW